MRTKKSDYCTVFFAAMLISTFCVAPIAQAELPSFLSDLKGKVTYDKLRNQVTIRYDFRNSRQLLDFEINGNEEVKIEGGRLVLKRHQKIKHCVKFKTIVAQVQVGEPTESGYFRPLQFSEKISLVRDSKEMKVIARSAFSEKSVGLVRFPCAKLRVDGKEVDAKDREGDFVLKNFRKGNSVPACLKVGSDNIRIDYGSYSAETNNPKTTTVGQLELEGKGEDPGVIFSSLIISGEPESDWVSTPSNR